MNTDEQIKEIIGRYSPDQASIPSPETKIVDAGFDSLDFIEMLIDFEDDLNIEIDDDEWEPNFNVWTVQQMIDFVKGRVDGK